MKRALLLTIVCSLLFLTAALKVFHAADSAMLQAAYGVPQWMLIVAVQAELLIGFFLLSERWRRGSWLAAVTLFSLFAAFSLFRILAGYESCGCFGSLRVNPWWSFLLDVGVVSLLIVQRNVFLETRLLSAGNALSFAGAAAYVVVGGLSLVLMARSSPASLRGGGLAPDDDRLVILEPSEWVGSKFPLVDAISPEVNLSEGEWALFLYHHDCPKCERALPRYERLAEALIQRGGPAQVVLVEVPPYGEAVYDHNHAKHARLSADREWFVETPVEIQLSDGKVRLASTDLPSIASGL